MARNTNIFLCEPIEGGFSYSITSRLGNIISNAEKLFGERNKDYTLLGIELTNGEYPQIWFPNNCRHIVIQITFDCLTDMNEAIFQVAHECVHCLCPNNTGKPTTILEEGLATWFSIDYTSKLGINIQLSRQNYQIAYELVSKLLEYDFSIIKKARITSPNISDITTELLLSLCPNISNHLVNELTKPFDYNR